MSTAPLTMSIINSTKWILTYFQTKFLISLQLETFAICVLCIIIQRHNQFKKTRLSDWRHVARRDRDGRDSHSDTKMDKPSKRTALKGSTFQCCRIIDSLTCSWVKRCSRCHSWIHHKWSPSRIILPVSHVWHARHAVRRVLWRASVRRSRLFLAWHVALRRWPLDLLWEVQGGTAGSQLRLCHNFRLSLSLRIWLIARMVRRRFLEPWRQSSRSFTAASSLQNVREPIDTSTP